MSRFRLKDQRWREWVDDGTKTMQEYNEWRYGQIAVGQRWEAMKDTIAHDIHNTNMIAQSITKGYMPEVYANNFNYGTYEAEVGSHIDTSFTLYDRQTVERIMRDDPNLLPAPGKKTSKRIAEGKDVLWNKKQIQSVMTQGILQGESIPKLSKRLATTVGDKNYKAAIRNARTMTTGAQNAGRMDSYKRAESMGIDMEVEWIATLDGRTRHEHRMLDGQMRPVGKPFEVEGVKIQYAGDPHAPGNMIYNCRCTLAGHVKGFDAAEVDRDTSAIGDMSYDDWKKSKDIKSNPIDLQEQKGKAIAGKYKKEYNNNTNINNFRGSGSGYNNEINNNSGKSVFDQLKEKNIEYKEPSKLNKELSEREIIKKLHKYDTGGHCTSLAYAYIGNKYGYDVIDFRNDGSTDIFGNPKNMLAFAKKTNSKVVMSVNDFTAVNKLKRSIEEGKEYILSTGTHAAIVRKINGRCEYCELQKNLESGFIRLTSEKLKKRFGCREHWKDTLKNDLLNPNILIDIDVAIKDEDFIKYLGYINNQ